MAANPHDAKKRSRETLAMGTSNLKEPSDKRRKEDSIAIPKVAQVEVVL